MPPGSESPGTMPGYIKRRQDFSEPLLCLRELHNLQGPQMLAAVTIFSWKPPFPSS